MSLHGRFPFAPLEAVTQVFLLNPCVNAPKGVFFLLVSRGCGRTLVQVRRNETGTTLYEKMEGLAERGFSALTPKPCHSEQYKTCS
nr:MAG TPA: hypothetical protein [Caudoviricetes sp.]